MSITRTHPPNVAHYVGINYRISLQRNSAIVLNCVDGSVSDLLPLLIPSHPEMPPTVALFNKRAIRWLMNRGYIPTLVGREVVLVPSDNALALNELLTHCDQVITGLDEHLKVGFDEVADLLEEFKCNLERKKFYFALDAIERARETYQSPDMRRLYASFLVLLEIFDKASAEYLILAEQDQLRAAEYYEKAFMCDPSNLDVYQKLDKVIFPGDKRRMLNYALYGFLKLALSNPDVAETLKSKALWIEPNKPLLFLAVLQMTKEKEEREKLYVNLALIFQAKGEEATFKYYLKKNNREYSVYLATPRTAARLAQERADREYAEFIKDIKDVLTAISSQPNEEGYTEEYDPATYADTKQKIVKSIKGHTSFAYYKGRLDACLTGRDQIELQTVLEELFRHYQHKGKTRKAEVVARLLFKEFGNINTGLHLGSTLQQVGKKEEWAAHLLGLALHEFSGGYPANVDACLKEIQAVDPIHKRFSFVQKQFLYLLEIWVRGSTLSFAEKSQGVKIPPFSHPVPIEQRHPIISHSTTTFLIDHPQFVGCHITPNCRMTLTTTTAEVYPPVNGASSFELHIPTCKIPVDRALSRRKTIQYLLQIGFVPVLQENQVRLVHPDEIRQTDCFIDEAGRIMERLQGEIQHLDEPPGDETSSDSDCEEVGRDALVTILTHVERFQIYLSEGNPALALYELTCAAKITTIIAIQELCADYLFSLQKKVQAKEIYCQLSKRETNKGKAYYLERAFFCDMQDTEIDQTLQELETAERRHFRYLCAFMMTYRGSAKQADYFYRKVCFEEPLMRFAYLQTLDPRDKPARMRVLTKLAEYYNLSSNEAISNYYSALSQIENNTATEEGLSRAITGESDPILRKKIAVALIDNLIEGEFYDMAAKTISIAVAALKVPGWDRYTEGECGRFQNEKNSFAKRELVILSALGEEDQLKRATQTLMVNYVYCKKDQKTTAVARFACEKLNNFFAESVYIEGLMKLGQHEEAARAALKIGFLLISKDCKIHALTILKMIPANIIELLNPEEQHLYRLQLMAIAVTAT